MPALGERASDRTAYLCEVGMGMALPMREDGRKAGVGDAKGVTAGV
jgi:hypothetical protein